MEVALPVSYHNENVKATKQAQWEKRMRHVRGEDGNRAAGLANVAGAAAGGGGGSAPIIPGKRRDTVCGITYSISGAPMRPLPSTTDTSSSYVDSKVPGGAGAATATQMAPPVPTVPLPPRGEDEAQGNPAHYTTSQESQHGRNSQHFVKSSDFSALQKFVKRERQRIWSIGSK